MSKCLLPFLIRLLFWLSVFVGSVRHPWGIRGQHGVILAFLLEVNSEEEILVARLLLSCLTWVLETELRSPVRTVASPNIKSCLHHHPRFYFITSFSLSIMFLKKKTTKWLPSSSQYVITANLFSESRVLLHVWYEQLVVALPIPLRPLGWCCRSFHLYIGYNHGRPWYQDCFKQAVTFWTRWE